MKAINLKLIRTALTLSGIGINIGISDAGVKTDGEVAEIDDYVVTGSHFNAADLVVDLPLTTIDNEDLRLWGHQSAYTALIDQPFAYGYANSDTQSNGLKGSAGANLRGLGNLKTLTLINGRRAGGNSAVGFEHGGFADLNLVPAAAIREIQVAVDGTSVTYGSDAVGGTVNLLLYEDFFGNRVDASYSDTTDGDAAEKSFSFLTGQQLNERTRIVLVGSWYERNAIFARDRDLSESADFRAQGGTDQRSDTFPGRINVNGQAWVLDGVSFPTSTDDYKTYSRHSDGFNYNDYAPAIPSLEQKSVMAHAIHQLTDQVETWTELLYTKYEFGNALAPAPWSSTFFPDILTAAGSSPHRPDDLKESDIDSLSYRNLELGNLEIPSEKQAHRLLLGLRGEIDRWSWETAVMQIKSDHDREISGIADKSALIESINSGRFNPYAKAFASGRNDGVDFDNAAALRGAATTAHESFNEQYRSIDFMVDGPAFELPAGDVKTLLGSQYRKEEVDIDIDPSFIFPGLPGAWSAYNPYAAERTVFSLFGESISPLLGPRGSEEMEFNLQLAFRYDDYTDKSGGLTNDYDELVYKAGFEFIPLDSVTMNGSFSTAFRAPTFNESFNTNYASLVYDTGTKANPSFDRYWTALAANPDLDPEKSKVLNLGIAYAPKFAAGLTARVNYYRIETKDAINHNGQDLVDGGAAGFIFATRFNTAEVLTDGLEYEITYLHQDGNNSWEAGIGLNQVLRYEIRPGDDAETIDFLDRLVHPLVPGENVQGPGSIPKFKGYARLLWSRKGLTLGGIVHYIHSLEDNRTMTREGRAREIDSFTALDLVARHAWPTEGKGWLSGTTLRLGLENVTDEAPPFAAGAFADGYDSSLYSLGGRRISLSASKNF